MAKKVKCFSCGKAVDNHSMEDAIECVEDLEIYGKDIEKRGVFTVALDTKFLAGRAQKHADKNIITLTFSDGEVIQSVTPEKAILLHMLKSQKEADDGDKRKGLFGGKDNEDTEEDESGDEPD